MKRILTIIAIVLLAGSFANASTIDGGKARVKTTAKSTIVKYVKFTAKDFCVKKMQDTKDILMPYTPKPVIDNTPAKG